MQSLCVSMLMSYAHIPYLPPQCVGRIWKGAWQAPTEDLKKKAEDETQKRVRDTMSYKDRQALEGKDWMEHEGAVSRGEVCAYTVIAVRVTSNSKGGRIKQKAKHGVGQAVVERVTKMEVEGGAGGVEQHPQMVAAVSAFKEAKLEEGSSEQTPASPSERT